MDLKKLAHDVHGSRVVHEDSHRNGLQNRLQEYVCRRYGSLTKVDRPFVYWTRCLVWQCCVPDLYHARAVEENGHDRVPAHGVVTSA